MAFCKIVTNLMFFFFFFENQGFIIFFISIFLYETNLGPYLWGPFVCIYKYIINLPFLLIVYLKWHANGTIKRVN